MAYRPSISFIIAFILSVLWTGLPATLLAQSSGATGQQTSLPDQVHDFDFDLGVWKTHTSRLLHPLTGSKVWADMDGVTVVRKVWGGRANIAEYKADGPAGHVELISLRWYNPAAHQWNLDFATPNVGTLGVPMFGEFKNGRADFYDQEPLNGKFILVRFSIWSITSHTAQSEQAFSEDGGKTWEVNWINKYTRADDQTKIDWTTSTLPEQAAQKDFDFNFGIWHTHIKRILDPFSNPTKTLELNGTVTVRKLWGGRGQLEEIETDGPSGHWEGLTLFLYNPQAHQWNQSFINSKQGVLSSALIGSFKDGRGELFAQDTFKDRAILVRGVWADIEPDSHSYEESYSDDGGKTWRAAFVAHLTREPK